MGISSPSSINTGGGDYLATSGGADWRIAYADSPEGPWTARDLAGGTPLGSRSFYGSHYADGRWVVVGNAGRIFTATTPGGAWAKASEPTSDTLFDVVYAEGVWVAVGASGGIYTATSPGGTWTSRTSGTSETLYGVAHGGGKFVAVGTNGTILYADDPTGSWSSATSGTATVLRAVAYGNGRWIAVGGTFPLNDPFSAANPIARTATDPTGSWSSVSPGGDFAGYGFGGIRYLDGYWLACGYGPSTFGAKSAVRYTTSPTGTWSSAELPGPTDTYSFITFDGDLFAVQGPGPSKLYHQEAAGTGWGLILR